MKVIVKPLGLVVLCASLVTLSVLAFRNGGAGAHQTPDPTATVYDEGLHPGWTTEPWATLIAPDDHSVVHGGRTALRARIDHYLGVRFTHTPTGTGRYDRLCFFINGGEHGGQRLHVQALLGGQKTDQRVLLDTLPPQKWMRVIVPLAELKIDNKSDFNQFWIQDVSGSAQSECFIDDVQFLRPGETEPDGDTLTTSLAPRENW